MSETETRPSYEELLAQRNQLIEELTFDELTGLYRTEKWGRKVILERVKQALQGSQNLVLALFDIRGLRVINNSYDHETGDQVLKTFADKLREIVGENGLGMRSHTRGDEFGVLFLGLKTEEIEKRLREFQNKRLNWETQEASGNISFTLGIVGLKEIKESEKMTEGELFQALWKCASEKEREEHRKANG
ncbi:MAG: diguanylate cyclase/phosphodiesterase [Microgenomates group bacterium LiPW_31]|nr:MAG: diguanylate cyclase/phosphodiesterase [Microgenomates group bacterium LiPW_31]